MNERNKKVIILVVIGVVFLISIGFAAFSELLTISTTASFTPTSTNIGIKFSKESGSVKDGQSNPVIPTTTGNVAAENAIIANTDNPTIENLNATFSAPGDSVKYEFYVLNTGQFDAYLTSVLYNGTPFKECNAVSGGGADPALVSKACNTINVKVTVGDTTFTAAKTLGINDMLVRGANKKVIVEIIYNGPARADGPFTVNFGDIELIYSTAQSSDSTSSVETICTAVDTSKSGSTELGTQYTCQVNNSTSYNFYVLSTDGNNVNLIMSENLANNVNFADSTNFSPIETSTPGAYDISFISNPLVITTLDSLTQDWGNLSNLNETYSTYATFNGKARLAKKEEIASTICTEQRENQSGEYYDSCPSWIVGDYWTITKSNDFTKAWGMNSRYNTLDDYEYRNGSQTGFYNLYGLGIRPVITVLQSQLN